MGLFKNIFSCYFDNNNDNAEQHKINENVTNNMRDISDDVKLITNDVHLLFRIKNEMSNDIKRLEDKINNHFAILTNKIDNVIFMLKK